MIITEDKKHPIERPIALKDAEQGIIYRNMNTGELAIVYAKEFAVMYDTLHSSYMAMFPAVLKAYTLECWEVYRGELKLSNTL